jgi:hypothetical protein
MSSYPGNKIPDGKMKQIKKEEPTSFKIETTVATSDMIKKLVGDNTPDEEEEPAPVAPPQAPKLTPAPTFAKKEVQPVAKAP